MQNAILIAQAVLSAFLIVLILMQPKGTGLAKSMGSSVSFTRRGLEKVVFKLTFVIASLLTAVSIYSLTF